MTSSPSNTGWHRADIVAAVHKQGSTLARLGRENGFALSTLSASLGIRHPKAHAVIARFIGVPAAEIWPQFYAGDRRVASHGKAMRRGQPASSQKRGEVRT